MIPDRFCDNPEEHGCGRRRAPLAPGYRYDQVAVNEAVKVIERGAGPHYYYSDDPRNIVQDVLDIFTDHGGLVAMDLGYEATIIDLKARLARRATEIVDVDALLREAGIEYPLGIAGLHDLVSQRDGEQDRAEEAEATIIDLRAKLASADLAIESFIDLYESNE